MSDFLSDAFIKSLAEATQRIRDAMQNLTWPDTYRQLYEGEWPNLEWPKPDFEIHDQGLGIDFGSPDSLSYPRYWSDGHVNCRCQPVNPSDAQRIAFPKFDWNLLGGNKKVSYYIERNIDCDFAIAENVANQAYDAIRAVLPDNWDDAEDLSDILYDILGERPDISIDGLNLVMTGLDISALYEEDMQALKAIGPYVQAGGRVDFETEDNEYIRFYFDGSRMDIQLGTVVYASDAPAAPPATWGTALPETLAAPEDPDKPYWEF